MLRTGRAAVYEKPNTPFVLKAYPLRPVRTGEVLVRITMSTICRSDIHSWEGKRPNPCPGILGHEIIGVIEELGAGIEKDMRGQPLGVGERITWTEYFFDGQAYYRDILDMPQKCDWPFIINRPLNEVYAARAAQGRLKSYEIFDFTINGVDGG